MKNFDEIYEKLQLNHSIELNNLRNKFKSKITIKKYNTLFIIILFIILLSLNYIFVYSNYKTVFYILTLILLLILIKLLNKTLEYKKIKYPSTEQIKIYNNINITNYIEYFKKELIKDLINNINPNIIYSYNNGLNEETYRTLINQLNEKKYTKYISEDYIKINNTWIYDVSTYRNETNNIKNEYKIFSGLVSLTQVTNNNNFIISTKKYNINKINKINKYNIYINNYEIKPELKKAFDHFLEYTKTDFDLICKNNYIVLRTHFNCMFDPNIYKGYMPKKLLNTYYTNLYELLLLIENINKYI